MSGLTKIEPQVELSAMSVPQLTETARMLDTYQEKIESMSGICATMRGLVFVAVKEKLDRGEFLPWLKKNFDKTRKTAAEDMRVGRGFVKCNPTLHFGDLFKALAKKANEPELDRSHPFVSQVEQWVKGRSRAQLLLEFPSVTAAGLKGKKRKHTAGGGNVNDAAEVAKDLWAPHLDFLEQDGIETRSWKDLPTAELARLREAVGDLGRLLKTSHKGHEGAQRK